MGPLPASRRGPAGDLDAYRAYEAGCSSNRSTSANSASHQSFERAIDRQ
jgi:hypothetical protein